jgi:hypothetical protein
MVLAINKATDYAVDAKCKCNMNAASALTGEVVQVVQSPSTRTQYTRAIAGLLLHDVDHLNYIDDASPSY